MNYECSAVFESAGRSFMRTQQPQGLLSPLRYRRWPLAIAFSSAVVSWSGDAQAYTIEYGVDNFAQGLGTIVSGIGSNQYTLEGLLRDTEYSVYVRSNCSEGSHSDWSPRLTFRTSDVGIAAPDINGAEVTVYPNPASDMVTIELQHRDEGDVEYVIEVVDVAGRKVISRRLNCAGQCKERLDLEGLDAGSYFVRLSAREGGTVIVRKLVVKR